MMSLDDQAARRLWQFMEQLAETVSPRDLVDLQMVLLDPVTTERIQVGIDAEAKRYHSLSVEGIADADRY
jgi:hypothetical protein